MNPTPFPLPGKPRETGVSGLFRLESKDLPALQKAANELNMGFFSVDLQNARNVPGFIKALKRDLSFPNWFGGNLDALHDCLTDFSWHPAPGYVIALIGSDSLRANPTSFATFNAVLSSAVGEWQKRSTPFRVFYVQDPLAPQPDPAKYPEMP